MKTFKRIILGLLVLILLLVIIAFLLPKSYHVERSIYVSADQSILYDLTSHLQKWDIWTAWTKELDSTAKYELFGPDGQTGTTRKWQGKIIGNGEMTLTELVPGGLVAYDLAFDQGKYKSKGKIIIENQVDSCKVSWIDEGDMGYNPINRYMGLFMEKMMAPDFEKGLAKLKKVAEERKSWPIIEERIMEEQVVLLVRDSAGPGTYGQVMGKAFGEIMGFIQVNKLTPKGAPFSISLKWDSVTMNSVMDIGMAVENADKGKGRIRVEIIPTQNVVIAHYFGPYDKVAAAYYILEKYIKESGKEISGWPREIYITGPMTEKDSLKWATDILYPVK